MLLLGRRGPGGLSYNSLRFLIDIKFLLSQARFGRVGRFRIDRGSRYSLSSLGHFGHELAIKLAPKSVEKGRSNLVVIGMMTATPCIRLTMKRQIGGRGSCCCMGYVWVVIIGCCGAGAALLTCRRAGLAESCGLKDLRVGRCYA